MKRRITKVVLQRVQKKSVLILSSSNYNLISYLRLELALFPWLDLARTLFCFDSIYYLQQIRLNKFYPFSIANGTCCTSVFLLFSCFLFLEQNHNLRNKT